MLNVPPRLILSKLAFGPTEADLVELARLGAEPWLKRQLAAPAHDGLERRLAGIKWRLRYRRQPPASAATGPRAAAPDAVQVASAAGKPIEPTAFIDVDVERSVGVLARSLPEHWQLIADNEPGQERQFLRTATAIATLVRAVHSPWQLREVMVDFWHNHFNVNALGEPNIAVALPSYDRDVIRAHALGNFRAMLEAVAQSAAMQIYLNNRS
ncbi:MAG: DUF1800 family protein, partial [Proteobacteria bacterium]|nr:DUF1800 family protein [Pseudomonadota bacterium]